MARLGAESAAGNPRPFRADNGSDSANQKGDHQPAHTAILPGGNRWYIRVAVPLLILADLAALALPGRAAAKSFTRRGAYRLFCSLHPARMTQLVIVR